MQHIRSLSLIGVLALGACLHTDAPIRRDDGYILVSAPATATTNATVQGLFFVDPGGLTFPSSRFARDSCQIVPFTQGSAPLVPPGVQYLSAGDSITMQTDSTIAFLKPSASPDGSISYVLASGGSIPFTPGSTVTFNIPGAPDGYPPSTLTGQTVVPYTLGAIDTLPDPTVGLPITWSPAGDDSSSIILSLQYSSQNSGTPDEQIYCALRDDGVDTIPGAFLDGWRKSTSSHHVDSYRWRSTIGVGQTQLLGVVSQFNVSKATFP